MRFDTSATDMRFAGSGCTLIVLAEWKPPVYSDDGIRVITASTRRNAPSCLDSKIHHNNLLNNILAAIEANVAGALNANFAFYRGMSEGGMMADMPEGEMLATVWEQVDEVRGETEEWLYSYLFMAYTPLSDEELAEYVAFSEGQTGQTMHRALFEGFDVMYVAISRALGQGIAQIRSAQDL